VSWIRKLQCHPRLKGLLTFVPLVHHISSSSGFPLDHEAVSKIFLAEFVSTIEHLTEVKELFTPDYFREKKIPLVLANILSSAIQCLGQEETPHRLHHLLFLAFGPHSILPSTQP
jgi:hypothetical protein